MNGALTDEYGFTAAEERALSSPLLTPDDMHHSDGPGSLSHVSSFCVQSETLDTTYREMHRHTDSFYILQMLRVLVFQQ